METAPTILVVDDEEAIRESCRQALERCCYRVETASDAATALKIVHRDGIDLVLLDLRMPGLDGMEFLRRVRSDGLSVIVIIITGYSSVESAVECMRLGAYDYLPKPFDADSLRLAVGRAVEKRQLAKENAALRRRLRAAEDAPDLLLGRSETHRRLQDLIDCVAQTESTVLILGESGTGKELVARAIHRAGRRCDKPMLAVDCGALVESLFESELFGHVKGSFTGAASSRPGRLELAEGGTVFFDEIGNLGPSVQAKLLRVIQEKEITRVGSNTPLRIDVRIIAATNQNLPVAIAAGRFREDLYYRLSVVQIELPSLRERKEEIPVLIEGLLRRLAQHKGLPPTRVSGEVLRLFMSYDWPGNVRELENKLERAMILARGAEVLPEHVQFGSGIGESTANDREADLRLSTLEARHIRRILEQTGWRMTHAAGLLGIDRKTLRRKIKAYHFQTRSTGSRV